MCIRDRQRVRDEENANQKMVSINWMTKHIGDYNRCQANGKILATYLEENDLEWTVDNLDLAFAATESQLAPLVLQAAPVAAVPEPTPVINPPVEVSQAVAPTPVPVIKPEPVVAAETPVPPAPAPNVQAPAARPGVNGGLIPGQQSAPRPVAGPLGLTMKDIKGWTADQM